MMPSTWTRKSLVPQKDWPTTILPTTLIPDDVDYDGLLAAHVQKLNAIEPGDFAQDCFWRDILAFTNTFRTLRGAKTASSLFRERQLARQISDFNYIPGSGHAARIGPGGFVVGGFTFKIGGALSGQGSGAIAVVPEGEDWKIWFLTTIFEGSERLGNPDVLDKVSAHSGANGTRAGAAVNSSSGGVEFDCVIIGAGQSGLALLGRLKALGVRAIALEKNDSIGGNWTGRYETVKLHTSKYYSSMPFGNTFHGDDYPYFLAAKDLARGFQEYVKDYGLNVRLSTAVNAATWDAASRSWTIKAMQNGRPYEVKASHIVFAIGPYGQYPLIPDIPNRDRFPGTVMHAAEYKSSVAWKGKRAIIVGTANTAHDVAEDMLDAGLTSITMIQRGVTPLMPFPFFKRIHEQNYNPDANIALSDRQEHALPLPVLGALSRTLFGMFAAAEPQLFEGLEKRGFRTGIPDIQSVFGRGGGHYLDVGCTQKIMDGKIDVKHSGLESFTPTGLRFSDGSTLDADVVVLCTGYKSNIRDHVEEICGTGVGELLEDNGGYDEEGEIRGAWKAHGHPRIWYASGDFGMSRFYSRFLALQIKADLVGTPFAGLN